MSVMGDMMKVLSMPCRKHADIISHSFDAELSKGTRWGLWVHERYCTGCRGYHQQFQVIRDGAAKLFGVEHAHSVSAAAGAGSAGAGSGGAGPRGSGGRAAGSKANRHISTAASVVGPCPPEVRERLVAAVTGRSRGSGA